MCQTLFTIPLEIAGIPVFGCGWLLAVWAVAAALTLGGSMYRHGWSAHTRGYLPALALSAAAIVFLLPRLTESGGLPIRGYGVMLLVAVGSAVAMSAYRARRLGLDPEMILSLAFWLFVAGILGTGVLHHRILGQIPETNAAGNGFHDGQRGAGRTGGLWIAVGRRIGADHFCVQASPARPGHERPGGPQRGAGHGAGTDRVLSQRLLLRRHFAMPPWAVSFPWHSPPHQQQVLSNKLYIHGLLFGDAGEAPPVIAAVEPGSPAEMAGLVPGQHVTQINSVEVDTTERRSSCSWN